MSKIKWASGIFSIYHAGRTLEGCVGSHSCATGWYWLVRWDGHVVGEGTNHVNEDDARANAQHCVDRVLFGAIIPPWGSPEQQEDLRRLLVRRNINPDQPIGTTLVPSDAFDPRSGTFRAIALDLDDYLDQVMS
jgi:hypothetical protein